MGAGAGGPLPRSAAGAARGRCRGRSAGPARGASVRAERGVRPAGVRLGERCPKGTFREGPGRASRPWWPRRGGRGWRGAREGRAGPGVAPLRSPGKSRHGG